jgi:DNA polymerase-3 subunit beta
MNVNDFAKILKAALICAGKMDVRYYLNGILFEISENGSFTIVSTDGHRLSKIDLDGEFVELPAGRYILSRYDIENYMTLLSKKSCDEIKVSKDEENIVLTTSRFSLNIDLVDGKFPDYHRVIPNGKAESGEDILNADYLIDAMKVIKELSNDSKGTPARLKTSTPPNATVCEKRAGLIKGVKSVKIIIMPLSPSETDA